MTALAIPVLSTDRFTWIPASREFVAEASDLGAFVGRVYDDAIDVGFHLESARTGSKVLYVLLGEERDGEGDLVCETFACASPPDYPDAPLVRVFND